VSGYLAPNRTTIDPTLKGKDATEAFEDVGHSDEARALLPGMLIGEFEKGANVSPTLTFPSSLSDIYLISGGQGKIVPIYCCCCCYGQCCSADIQVRPFVASSRAA
jgi:cytochrome b involved in lipid metabolism